MGKLHKNTKISLVVLFLVPIILSTIGLSICRIVDKELYLRDLYAQGEIVILNDNDFSDKFSLPGSGTAENPFLIEDYIFDDPDTTAIVIKDTTKHFIIRNCSIKKYGQPIFISNIGFNTGTVINNTFVEDRTLEIQIIFKDPREGNNYLIFDNCYVPFDGGFINIINAPGIRVEDNIFQSNPEEITYESFGLNLWTSDYSVINNNTLSFFSIGINLFDSLYLTVVNNFCYNNSNGICFRQIEESLVMNNICTKNGYGIKADSCQKVLFITNNLSCNLYVGFQVFSQITLCQIRGNLIVGSEFGLSGDFNNCNITYNYFSLNLIYGIRLDEYHSYWNYIHHNSFINNNYEGSMICERQAYDNPYYNNSQNYWYDDYLNEGNYWSDLIWNENSVYLIGGGNATDQHPLFEPPTMEFWEGLY